MSKKNKLADTPNIGGRYIRNLETGKITKTKSRKIPVEKTEKTATTKS